MIIVHVCQFDNEPLTQRATSCSCTVTKVIREYVHNTHESPISVYLMHHVYSVLR